MSGALTTGETLTGGSSGATGVVESLTSLGTAAITNITQSEPPIVTCGAGHNFKEGQTVQLSSVGGMVDVNSGFFTVKNVTATTFELFAEATATSSAIINSDGTGFECLYIRWYCFSHNRCIIKCKGEFTGETCTGSSSSNTVLLFSSIHMAQKVLSKKHLIKQKVYHTLQLKVMLCLLLM